MSFLGYLNDLGTLSLHDFACLASAKMRKELASLVRRFRDTWCPTYETGWHGEDSTLLSYWQQLPIDLLQNSVSTVEFTSDNYQRHWFDLLGSGWVNVRHGMECRGIEGSLFDVGRQVAVCSEGSWLEGRINAANLKESKRIWKLVGNFYIPIDWHLDFKSGYRWSEATWYRDISYGDNLGVDVKVPWELSRMQHLPMLAFRHALSDNPKKGSVWSEEFANQVLDFAATNPPRFGVNWNCTMDVAIRVVNWLVTYDLFRSCGMVFASSFREIFQRCIFEHGKHIYNNLEWYPTGRGNHYLADVAGLLFVAAYLPCSPSIDSWLTLAVHEFLKEVDRQFHQDGSNFEGSVSYHRLSAEIAVYASALIAGLPEEKQAVLQRGVQEYYQRHPLNIRVILDASAGTGSAQLYPLPLWLYERLEKMAGFTMDITRPDGHVPQIGDNDNGRFLKLQPVFRSGDQLPCSSVDKSHKDRSEGCFLHEEDHLDHRHLVAAINGVVSRDEFSCYVGPDNLETLLVSEITGKLGVLEAAILHRHARFDSSNETRFATAIPDSFQIGYPADVLDEKLHPEEVSLSAYHDFGLYLYRTERLYLAIRCGYHGQEGRGGHSHNDQLSIELALDGVPVIVDPGTYNYTALPERRNLFRSTLMHSTLVEDGREQNVWLAGRHGLFRLDDRARAQVIESSCARFAGEHYGYSVPTRRIIEFINAGIAGKDCCPSDLSKCLYFHLAPVAEALWCDSSESFIISVGRNRFRLSSDARGSVTEGCYSDCYGSMCLSKVIELHSSAHEINWTITVEGAQS